MLQRNSRPQEPLSPDTGLSPTSLVTAVGSREVANMATDDASSIDRVAAEIAKSVPEAYEGQHAAGLQAMLSGDAEEAKLAAFTMLVYQVSNGLVDYDDDEDDDNKYQRIVDLFRDIGLPRHTWEQHFTTKRDRSSAAFAEKLFEAAVNAQDLEVLEALLNSGADPNQPIMTFMNCFCERPIQAAADSRVCNVEMARLLIKAGAAVGLTTEDNPKPAIHNAAQRGTWDMVQLLVESGADIHQGHTGGAYSWNTSWTPLVFAADTWSYDYDRPSRSAPRTPAWGPNTGTERRNVKIVRYLAGLHKKRASKRDQLIIQGALITACGRNNPSLVHVLCQAGGDIAQANSRRVTPLEVAASHWRGETGVVSYLLEHGAPIDGRPQRPSALHIAAVIGIKKMVAFLIEKGADVNARAKIDLSVYRDLLGKGFSPPGRRGTVTYTPLQLALHKKNEPLTSFFRSTKTDEAAVALLEAGAELVGGELAQAVHFLSRRLVGALLERGANPNERDSSGRSALQEALETYKLCGGEGECVSDILVDAGAAVGEGDMYLAVAAGDVRLVRLFAENATLSQRLLRDTGPQGESLLEAALCSQSREMIAMVLNSDKAPYSSGALCAAASFLDLADADAPIFENLLEKRKNGATREPLLEATALTIAAVRSAGQRPLTLRLLLSQGCQGNTCLLPYEDDYHNYTAIIHGYRFFQSLSDEYKNTGWWRKPDLIRCSPLVPVLSLQHSDRTAMTRLLLRAGYRPDPLSLLVAICKCAESEVEALIHHGADVNRPARHDLDTPLQLAVRRGDAPTALLLLKHGADVNALPAVLVPMFTRGGGEPNEFRPRSALQIAVEKGHLELLDVLLAAGADVNGPIALDGGASALQCAAARGYLGIARRLIEAGAEVNARRAERHGRTALEAAAEAGRLDTVQFLLEKGADTEGEEGLWQYLRARAFAERNGHGTVAGLLGQWRGLDRRERRCGKYWGLLDEGFKIPHDDVLDELYWDPNIESV